jgi:hypothetical protein
VTCSRCGQHRENAIDGKCRPCVIALQVAASPPRRVWRNQEEFVEDYSRIVLGRPGITNWEIAEAMGTTYYAVTRAAARARKEGKLNFTRKCGGGVGSVEVVFLR